MNVDLGKRLRSTSDKKMENDYLKNIDKKNRSSPSFSFSTDQENSYELSTENVMDLKPDHLNVFRNSNSKELLTISASNYCFEIMQYIEQINQNGKGCDLKLEIVSRNPIDKIHRPRISLHSVIACAASPYIRRLLENLHLYQENQSNNFDFTTMKEKSFPPSFHKDFDSMISKTHGNPESTNSFLDYASLSEQELTPFETPISVNSDNTILVLVKMDSIDQAILNTIRKFMYTGILEFFSFDVLHLLSLALLLELVPLVNLAIKYVQNNFDRHNIFHVIKFASLHDLKELEQSAFIFFDKNFDVLTQQEEWIHMDQSIIQILIQRDNISTENEMNIFHALLNWMNGSPSSRFNPFIRMICTDLRLEYISRPDLIELSQHPTCVNSNSFRRVLYNEALSRKKVRTYMRNARIYSITSQNISQPLNPISSPIENTKNVLLSNPPCCIQTVMGYRPIYALLSFNHFVLTGSDDSTISVFNSQRNWEVEHLLIGHTNTVVSLESYNNNILSASSDRTIRLWSSELWECIHVIPTQDSVCCMKLTPDAIVSAYDNGLLKLWSLLNWQQLGQVHAHQYIIWVLALYGNDVVISGSSDTLIKVWVIENNKFHLTAKLSSHRDEVQALVVDYNNHHLISGSDDGFICIHSCINWSLIRTISWKNHAIISLLTYSNKIVIGLGDGKMIVLEQNEKINDSNNIKTISAHSSCITGLSIFCGKLITSSYDRSLKIWA